MNRDGLTGGTLFGGFEGVGIGMTQAGIRHAWSIEYDPEIAAVARDNGYNSIVANILDCDAPAMTITTSHNQRDIAASYGGRVVKMTPRALARFQTFPGDYRLPDNVALACRGLGNAVPPRFMAQVYQYLYQIPPATEET